MGQNTFLESCPYVPIEGVTQEFRSRAEQVTQIMIFIESFFKQHIQEGLNKNGMLHINSGFTWEMVKEIMYSDPAHDNVLFQKIAQQRNHCAAEGIFRQEIVDFVGKIRDSIPTLRESLSIIHPGKPEYFYDLLLEEMLKDVYNKQIISTPQRHR
jgi:hypothetical protein